MLRIGESAVDPVLLQIAHYGYVDFAWLSKNVDLARVHSDWVMRIANKHSSPYLRVFALSAQALICDMSEDQKGALQALGEALALIRSAKVATEFETEILAGMAECYRKLGAAKEAESTACEAIVMARYRSTRLAECRALITLGATLLVHGDEPARDRADDALAQASQLIAITGARIYQEALDHARLGQSGVVQRRGDEEVPA
jgi:adenylate cyclase